MGEEKAKSQEETVTPMAQAQKVAPEGEPAVKKTSKGPEEGNFFLHGKYYMFADRSVFLLDKKNPIRLKLAWLVTWNWFDRFILFLILCNSIFLALYDYSVVDQETKEPVANGIDATKGAYFVNGTKTYQDRESGVNQACIIASLIFTYLFIVEAALKILAMGFVLDDGSYLRDGWNWLDFIVVVSGIIQLIPGMPSVAILRTFRVLRPLRSLTTQPRLKLLVTALLGSLPALSSVALLLFFAFTIFGILGLQMWTGLLHFRCRQTPYPLQLFDNHTADDYVQIVFRDCESRRACPPWTGMPAGSGAPGGGPWPITYTEDGARYGGGYAYSGEDYSEELGKMNGTVPLHPCLGADGNPILADENDDVWEFKTTPWATVRDTCVWPVNQDDTRVCGTGKGAGYMCPGPDNKLVIEGLIDAATWCGSNYDVFGHKRFAEPVMVVEGNYIGDLNFGLTRFDNILSAFLTIFQSITQEGWIDITYQVQDAFHPTVGALYFMMLIVFGSFFMLNLTLAVVWDNFSAGHEAMAELWEAPEETEEERQAKAAAHDKWRVTAWSSNPFIKCMFAFVNADPFEAFIILHILGNTIVLAMDAYGISEGKANALEYLNFYFTMAFLFEMICKWIGLGLKRYFSNAFNQFDCFVVSVSILETVATPPSFFGIESSMKTSGAFSALRTFRLFRLFKLARSWTSLQELLSTLAATMGDVSNFAILLLLFMYIYSLIGMQFFANRFVWDAATQEAVTLDDTIYHSDQVERSRAHFDNFLWAFTTIFQILSGENWNSVMYDGWRATGPGAAFYFLFLVLVGDWLVLNLFMAILLGNFENPPPDDDDDELTEGAMKILDSILACLPTWLGGTGGAAQVEPDSKNGPDPVEKEDDEKSECSTDGMKDPAVMNGTALMIWGMDSEFRKKVFWFCEHDWWENFILAMIIFNSIALAIENPLWDPASSKQAVMTFFDYFMTIVFLMEMLFKFVALGVIGHEHSYFRSGWNTLDGVIVITSVMSIFMSDANLKVLRVLRLLRVLRVLRLVSRNAALQLVVSALLRAIPGIINVTLVCSMFFLIFAIVGMNYFKHAFWGCAYDDMPSQVQALIDDPIPWTGINITVDGDYPGETVPLYDTVMAAARDASFGNLKTEYFGDPQSEGVAGLVVDGVEETCAGVAGLCFTLADMLALGGTNVTASAQAHMATGPEFADPLKPTSKEYCDYFGGSWEEVVPQKFDDVLWSFMALFEMSTTEGWVDVMLAAVDYVDIDMQPQENNNLVAIAFFMAFIIVGSFFIMNVFVGVVCATFNQTKAELGNKYNLMTDAQAEWARFSMQVFTAWQPRVRYKMPSNALRRMCFNAAQWPHFDEFIMLCILLNTIVMAIQFWGAPYVYVQFIDISNYTFGGIFLIECIVKLTAYGTRYFTSGWNVFDFCIVLGTLLGVVLKFGAGIEIGSVATIIRTFRVGRILRLVKSAQSLRILFATLVMTLPSLWNVGAILCLLFYMFSILGVQLFATIHFGDAYEAHANFRSFPTAFLTLVRCSTGENWNGMMYDMTSQPEGCLRDLVYDPMTCGFSDTSGCYDLMGCGTDMAMAFWVVFTLIITYVLLNLFIGIVLDGFGESSSQEYSSLSSEHKEMFLSLWQEYDPDAERSITVNELEKFVMQLPPPMGYDVSRQTRHYEVKQMITQLRLPTYAIDQDMKVLFSDVASAFAKRVYQTEKAGRGEEFEELDDDMELEIRRRRSVKEHKKIVTAGKTGAHGYHRHYAVVKLLLTYQTYKFRSNLCDRVKNTRTIAFSGNHK